MFLLDDFVMTTEQRTNLRFPVRLRKSPTEALCTVCFNKSTNNRLCLVQHFFLLLKRFKEGSEDVDDDPRCGTQGRL